MKKPKYPKINEIVNFDGKIFKIVYDESCNKCWFYRNGYCEVIKDYRIHCCTEYNYPVSYILIGNSIDNV